MKYSVKQQSKSAHSGQKTQYRKTQYRKTQYRKTPSPKSIPYIIYHEGGDSYRPIICVPVPKGTDWPKSHILYFRSSGRSNKGCSFLCNTWFPTIGLINRENESEYVNLISSSTVDNIGHIIKMSNIKKATEQSALPKQTLLVSTSIANLLFDYKRHLLDTIEMKTNAGSTTVTDLYVEYIIYKISKVLKTYFIEDWQIRQSAEFGCGVWENDADFHLFREYLCVTEINSIPAKINKDINKLNPDARDRTNNIPNVVDFANQCNTYIPISYFTSPEYYVASKVMPLNDYVRTLYAIKTDINIIMKRMRRTQNQKKELKMRDEKEYQPFIDEIIRLDREMQMPEEGA